MRAEHGAYRLIVMNAPDGFRQERGYGNDLNPVQLLFLWQGNRVCKAQRLNGGIVKVLDCIPTQNAMCGRDVNLTGTELVDEFGCTANGSRRANHIVKH